MWYKIYIGIHGGRYKTANDKTFDTSVNNALNIITKSSVVDTSILYGKGEVDTPIGDYLT